MAANRIRCARFGSATEGDTDVRHDGSGWNAAHNSPPGDERDLRKFWTLVALLPMLFRRNTEPPRQKGRRNMKDGGDSPSTWRWQPPGAWRPLLLAALLLCVLPLGAASAQAAGRAAPVLGQYSSVGTGSWRVVRRRARRHERIDHHHLPDQQGMPDRRRRGDHPGQYGRWRQLARPAQRSRAEPRPRVSLPERFPTAAR